MKKMLFVFLVVFTCPFTKILAINPPNLSLPSDNATGQKIALPVSWGSVSGATAYHYQLDTTSSFNSKWLKQDTITGLKDTVRYLQIGRKYYWRVRSLDATQVSSWSVTRSFTTGSLGADAYSPFLVTQRITIIDLGVDMRLQLDTTLKFNSGVLHEYTVAKDFSSSVIYSTSRALYFNQKYYIRVTVKDASISSGWSSPRGFTTPGDALTGSISNLYTIPLSGNFELGFNFDYIFQQSSPDTIYNELEVDTSSKFNSPVLERLQSKTTSAYTNGDFLLQNKKYYWRYRVVSSIDTSKWSPVYNFYTYGRAKLNYPSINYSSDIDSIGRFSFSMSKEAQYVQYAYDTNYYFTSPIISDTMHNNVGLLRTHYFAPFYYRTKYQYVKFKVFSALDTSDWFFYYLNFNKTVNPTAPADNYFSYQVNPVFAWNRIGNTKYEVQVDTSNKFNTKRLVRFFKDSSALVSDDLYYGRKQYWRVRAVHSRDSSSWSTIRSLTTTGKISLIVPVDKSTGVSPTGQIEANPIRGTDNYEIRMSEDSTFATYVSYTVADKPGFIVYTALSNFNVQYGKTYFWYIVGRHKRDSVFSDIWKFKMKDQDPIPAKVILVYPTNNYVDIPYTLYNVTFDWQDNNYTTEYELQYSTSSGFTSNINTQTATISEIKLFNFNPATVYYWRVRSKNLTGTGPWSDVWKFTTIGVLNVPNQLSPDNTNGISLKPKLDWEDIALATSYDFRIGEYAATLSSQTIYNTTISEAQLQNLKANTTYYWQVRSKNQLYVTGWSFIAFFETGNGSSVNVVPSVQFKVFPNPVVDNTFEISGEDLSKVIIKMYDIKGAEIGFNQHLQSNDNMRIDFNQDLQGLYILEIQTGEGISRVRLVLQ